MDLGIVDAKIQEYQHFLEETLKNDLANVQLILKNKLNNFKEWEEVRNIVKNLEEFQKKDLDIIARIGLSCGVYLIGEIIDYEMIYIDIGLGHLLELDCQEAERYANIRRASLMKDINHYRNLAVHIKVNIKMVLLAINELQLSLFENK